MKRSYQLFTLLLKDHSDIGKCNTFTINVEEDVGMNTVKNQDAKIVQYPASSLMHFPSYNPTLSEISNQAT